MNPKKKLGFLKGREKDKDHKGKNKPAKKEYGSDYADKFIFDQFFRDGIIRGKYTISKLI